MRDWSRARIGELLANWWPGEWGSDPEYNQNTAVVYRSTELDDEGHVHRSSVQRYVSEAKLASKKLAPGDVLLEASGGTPGRPVGRVGLYSPEHPEVAICSNFLRTLRPKPGVCPPYLRWVLMHLHRSPEIWRFQQQTTGMSNLHVKDYLRHEVDIAPPAQQQRIAEILSTVDEAIEQTEALIAKTQQIKAGLMHDLFTRGVTANGQLRPPREEAPQLYKESPLGWIPKEWELPNLGTMAEIVSGVTLNGDIDSGHIEVPYLRVANVQDGYLDLNDVKMIRMNAAQLSKLALRRGDVLMNEGGDFDKLGRGTVWNQEIDPCVHQNHVFRVRPRSEMLRSQFLAYWSQSAFGKKYFVLSSKQSTNLASINSTQLHKFPVARPDLEEQRRIEDRLGTADSQVVGLQNELAKLDQLKAGVMHDLLTGRVSVTIEIAPETKEAAASV